MSFELSLQVKILALVGFLLAAGLMGTLVLQRNHSSSNPVVVTPVTTPAHVARTPGHHHRVALTRPAAPTVQLAPDLPGPLRSALRHSRLVVAVVYAPGDAVDAEVLVAARQGAASQHAPVVALNIRSDSVAASTGTWMRNLVEPAVLVVRRPGITVVELDGYTDQASVAQAVADARR